MTKRQQRERGLKRLQQVKTWQLVLILVLALFVTATFLRLNNIGMVQRREAVMSADKQGDADILRNRLYDLQRYAAAHMNADTGVIYLQESYNRAWQAIQEAAQKQINPAVKISILRSKTKSVAHWRGQMAGAGRMRAILPVSATN